MHIICPHCRNPIELVRIAPREEIACSSCGSSFRLDTGSTTGWERGPGQKFGKFEVIGLVGRGGFGCVYKARDPELDRTVAVKVPRAANMATAEELDRFLREARSVAQLRHPSIVPVHDVGQSEGVPYVVSDFVQGVTLADLTSARRPGFREAAELIAAVADALQYAHEHGVIHRDVKPSNIMIGDDGTPFLMDFGLAKREAGEITMTVEGQVLGTPAYMPPEQARGEGHAVDARGDVYSLGVVLYQLLTGELPFRGTQRMLLHQVLHDDPRPLRGLNDRIPRDLETICLKAMAKEPGRRYATARDFADDLRRWLKGEPIKARPVGRLERAGRWARRHPAAAAAYGLLAAALLLGLGGGGATWLWLTAERARGDAVKAKGDAEAAQSRAETAEGDAEKARDDLKGALQREQDAKRQLTQYAYDDRIYLAQSEWDAGRTQRARELLQEAGDLAEELTPGKKPWEWDYANRVFHPELAVLQGHAAQVNTVAFSPDGRRLATASADQTARLWDAESGKPIAVLQGHADPVQAVSFSPDGRRLVTASLDQTVRLWDGESGKPLAVLQAQASPAVSVSFSPDGRRLVAACEGGTALLWIVRESPDEEAKRLAEQRQLLREQEALWHRQKAADAARLGQWFGAAFHLKRLIAAEPPNGDPDPVFTEGHYNLGFVLRNQGKLDEAVAEFREAIRRDPRLAAAHDQLGWALRLQGKLDEALVSCTRAVELQPGEANYHNSRGYVFWDQAKLDEAIAEFREAIRVNPKFGPAHDNLAEVERIAAVQDRLPAFLEGEFTPKTREELNAAAALCRLKKLYLACSRMYANAFAADPKMADDLKTGDRYNAATSAVLAAAGRGKDDPPPDDAKKAELRRQALQWLRADLAALTKLLDNGAVTDRMMVEERMHRWQEDADLAAVRDTAELAKLPAEEQQEWRKLWDDVAALLGRRAI